MLAGLASAAAGMAAQRDRMDALANDVANVNTTGYKHERTGFADLVYQAAGPSSAPNVQTGAGARVVSTGRSFQQGQIAETGRKLDVALQGPGFLRVRTADGRTALTRDGSLQLDARGRLTTSSGAIVQPQITVPTGAEPTIGPDGTVSAAGTRLGKLDIVSVRAQQGLNPIGDNLFEATAASGPARADGTTTVVQGSLEHSNVDLAVTMTDMIEAQRAYQLTSRVISTNDQLLEIANGVKR